MHELWRRLVFLFRRRQFDRELNEEIQTHLEMKSRDQDPGSARHQFGNTTLVKEVSRETWGWRPLEDLFRDVRYALRVMRRSPWFTAVAVLSLVLGIGANTAIFTVIHAILLRSLPVKDPGQLVQLRIETFGTSFSYPMFDRLRARPSVFSGLFAVAHGPGEVEIVGERHSVFTVYITGSYFPTLGVSTVIGRVLTDKDDAPGADPVAVISYSFWEKRFGGDPEAVGKTLSIEGVPLTIIGVTSPGFFGVDVGASPDISIPMALEPRTRPKMALLHSAGAHWMWIMARLKDGTSQSQARAQLEVLSPQIMREVAPREIKSERARRFFSGKFDLDPARNGLARLRRQVSEPLLILIGIAGLVLLIACANLGNLLLARASARHKELTIRVAIGAGRRRLLRQLLTESVVLGLLGGAGGLLIASWGSRVLATLIAGNTVMTGDAVLDLRPNAAVLAFTVAASLLTAIVFGLAPALRASRLDLGPGMKESRHGGSRQRLARTLVVSQVTLSLVLVAGAALMVRSLVNLLTFDAGFERGRVLLTSLNLSRTGLDATRRASLYSEAMERINRIPGVRSASFSLAPPVTGGYGYSFTVRVEGRRPTPEDERLEHPTNWIGPFYFRTLGTPILAGREFEPRDEGRNLAIVNETMARRYWPDANPIGQRIRVADEKESREIIGVARDMKYMDLREPAQTGVFLPLLGRDSANITVRTERVSPAAVASQVRQQLQSLASGVRIGTPVTLSQHVDRTLKQDRVMASLSSFFGLLGLVMAAMGLYGVMAYSVARRTSEIGIRMALGAGRQTVVWMVLREALLLAALGIAIGLPVAMAAARLVSSRLFGLTSTDAFTFTMAAVVMVVIALLASYIPARRASQFDPMIALRHE